MFDIVLHNQDFGGDLIQTIDGRDIHAALGIGRQYSHWVKEQIDFHQFIENTDFVRSSNLASEGRGGQNRVDYYLKWSHQTIDRLLHEYLETSDHG